MFITILVALTALVILAIGLTKGWFLDPVDKKLRDMRKRADGYARSDNPAEREWAQCIYEAADKMQRHFGR